MFKRPVSSLVDKALKRSWVVLINGAKRVGKTTLAEYYVQNHQFSYVTLDDELQYSRAMRSPAEFIRLLKKPVVIDEIQRVPELFLAIKQDVDIHKDNGRYLLTGSANVLLLPRLADSLAGRIEIIDLLPLSQGEILGKYEDFVDRIFTRAEFIIPKNDVTQEDLCQRMIQGGYPNSVLIKDEETREAWMRSYLSTILQKDITDIANIEHKSDILPLLQICAARSAGLLNMADLARDSKMAHNTAKRYLNILELLFLVGTNRPWSSNLITRFVKSSKLYVFDTGFLSFLTNSSVEGLLKNAPFAGKVFETFVVSELKKQISWSKVRPEMYHFRTTFGDEVDIVLENRKGEIVGIEVKNSSHVAPDNLKGLEYLQEKVKDRFVRGIVLYMGANQVPLSENITAMPVNALWES